MDVAHSLNATGIELPQECYMHCSYTEKQRMYTYKAKNFINLNFFMCKYWKCIKITLDKNPLCLDLCPALSLTLEGSFGI